MIITAKVKSDKEYKAYAPFIIVPGSDGCKQIMTYSWQLPKIRAIFGTDVISIEVASDLLTDIFMDYASTVLDNRNKSKI